MLSVRIAKVNSLLMTVVSTRLRETYDHPAALATVTDVETSPDLREAVVWISLLPAEADWQSVVSALPALQEAVAESATMKFTPRLSLRQDTGTVHARHIEDLLRGL